ncbi:hypothetical protein [uncultured Oceanisphaera sp.]|uniref:hypothetical protein n=1 Tax=uncultured Oceanisphaera sp. TaxID=353858 RepID=UPI002623BE8B|nr:hypothetical protein [uncultured Oceanisphaera sp.]
MEQSNPKNYKKNEHQYFSELPGYFEHASGNFGEKMHCFTKFVPRQSLAYFMARAEIYKNIIALHGSVFDFGIYHGGSFFTWLQLSSIYEPYNHIRKFVGFDSFSGFSEISRNDIGGEHLELKKTGGMTYTNGYEEIIDGINLLDLNRPLGHVKNTSVFEGEASEKFSEYLDLHNETIIAMANFGLGTYEPTVKILSLIKPRLQKGSVLVFEDLNQSNWPGETKALYEVFKPEEISLQRFPFCPQLSFMIYGS